jgi:hypothetical protein
MKQAGQWLPTCDVTLSSKTRYSWSESQARPVRALQFWICYWLTLGGTSLWALEGLLWVRNNEQRQEVLWTQKGSNHLLRRYGIPQPQVPRSSAAQVQTSIFPEVLTPNLPLPKPRKPVHLRCPWGPGSHRVPGTSQLCQGWDLVLKVNARVEKTLPTPCVPDQHWPDVWIKPY